MADEIKEKELLGQYRLESKLGEGGMGVVYLATDVKLHREVAIKVLHNHLLKNENLKERFRREARMHAKLMHPNVVTLLSLYEDGEQMALVMEMVHGKNLKEHLQVKMTLTLSEIVHICDSVLAGLDAAHKMGMVHRDLKPANVLLSDDGLVKLMDFGLAKPEGGDDDLTQSGATVGSFRYMSPEQIMNKSVDARTDLYAFGILLYQICTGRLPFDAHAAGGGEFEIMEKQVREKPTPPIKLVPALPRALSDLILKLLEKDPADRPANCAEVRAQLQALLGQEVSTVRVQEVRMPTRQTRKISNLEIAKGLLLALWLRSTKPVRLGLSRLKTVINEYRNKNESEAIRFSAPAWLVETDYWRRFLSSISKRWRLPSIPESWHLPSIPEPWRPYLIWGVPALAVLLLLLVVLLNSHEPAGERQATKAVEPEKSALVKPKATDQTGSKQVVKSATQPEKAKPAGKTTAGKAKVVAKPKPAPVAKSTPEPAKKVVAQPKPKPKPKPRPKPKPKRTVLATESGAYEVIRSDKSSVNPNKANEFRGGNHLFFPELEDYAFKETFHTKKNGESRINFEKPVNLSKIVIRKATVGRLSFRGGYVLLEVENSKGDWQELFRREDDDVDIAVTITKPAKMLDDVKSVRIRFRSPEPITIGPIDLIK